jgi:pilus assembly protein CpaC
MFKLMRAAKSMTNLRAFARMLFMLAGLLTAAPPCSYAEEKISVDRYLGRAVISVNKSKNISLKILFKEVIVGASDIADVIPVQNNTLYILGKKIGTTNITVYGSEKKVIGILDVEIQPDLNFIKSRVLTAISNTKNIRLSSANGSLIVSGSVPDRATADRVVAIIVPFTKNKSKSDVINALRVLDPQQVSLDVRIVEIQRNAAKSIGIRLSYSKGATSSEVGRLNSVPGFISPATTTLLGSGTPFGVLTTSIGNSGISGIINALESKGSLRQLAKPNLVALSGSKASFLVGGEFPIPTSSNNAGTQITYKRFGIMLDFIPTIYDNGLIGLKLTPEVSDLDYQNAITSGGYTIPAISARRADTEIILKSGQSFAIAGLLSQSNNRNIDQVPWLGTVPVLGALFRSPAYQKKETELVIIVTANLVQPATPRDKLKVPTDNTLAANDIDFFLNGKMELLKSYKNYVERAPGVKGPYGHIIEVE